MTVNTILFDMDGVVIDSEKLHLKAMGLTLERNGIAYPDTLLPAFVGKSDRSFFEYVRDHIDNRVNVDMFLEGKDALFNSLLPELRPVEGFLPFIHFVKERSIPTALVTSSSKWTVKRVDELLNVTKWFNQVIAEEDTTGTNPIRRPTC